MTTHTAFMPGRLFAGGRYRIERFLAEGGFGAVYVAEQTATEARVALKVLFQHVLQSADAVEKFRQEARIAGRVNSEHIVRVIDAGFDDETQMPFLVMELLEGADLGRVIEQGGPLPPERVVEYLRQTASALDRAHCYVDRDGQARPIVHRDLKPENLFLMRRENGESIIKVLDFGIAKILSATSNVSREVKGTPLYMAFEQAAGGTITPRTDVWALGLIAFYMLTARVYWRAAYDPEATLMQVFGEVLSLPLLPPSARLVQVGAPASLPREFDDWFARCVNRDPDQRFASAGAAIMALGGVFGVEAIASGGMPVASREPAAKGSSAPPSALAAAISPIPGLSRSAPVAATAGALAVSTAVERPPSRAGAVLVMAVVAVLALGGAATFVAFRTWGARAKLGTDDTSQARTVTAPAQSIPVTAIPTDAPPPVAPTPPVDTKAPPPPKGQPPAAVATKNPPPEPPRPPPALPPPPTAQLPAPPLPPPAPPAPPAKPKKEPGAYDDR